MFQKLKVFIKKETVLSIAIILAVLSMLAVPPDSQYISYFDFRTLAILFCLMAIVAGFRELGVFDWMAERLLGIVSGATGIVIVLVLLCFFLSMLITNDVALITFVPLTLIVFQNADKSMQNHWMMPCIVLQTIAANLGSMLTPIGNPQNLFLYGKAVEAGKMRGAGEFIKLMMPYSILSLLLLLICIAFLKIVFRKDALFIFIGNIGRIPSFSDGLHQLIKGREMLTAVLASQVMSNVPAAILLEKFTDHIPALIVGTNLGGLGTLIASMASLISFKYVAREDIHARGRYFLLFTVFNIAFLIFLLCAWKFGMK